jgi:hypothetical protein
LLGVVPSSTNQTLLDRMVQAVERVRNRLLRAAAALDAAGVAYAVIGGNAVAAWVATVDPAAVRNTQDVDILIRRADLDVARRALAAAGFVHTNVSGLDIFLDGAGGRVRDSVHIVFAGEKVREAHLVAAPDVAESSKTDRFHLISLEALVRMKLTSFRRKDQVHLLDMIEVGLVDDTWTSRLPPELGARLRHLIETPEE